MVPAAAASALAFIAVLALVHASHGQLLRGKTLAVVVLLGIVLLAVIIAGYVWAAHVAQGSLTAGGEQVGEERQPDPAPVVPAESPAQPEISGTEVYVHLSHRLQSLVHRQIDKIDGLEQMVEDPDLLGALFEVDHLATRIRRHAENLAVLGGSLPHRQWTKPVSVMEVLRSAASETLGYARVQFFAPGAGDLNGYALADVVHLLAELVENATAYSAREAKVTMRAAIVPAGLAIEIDDRGLGLAPEDYARLNALLRQPDHVDVHRLLREAHIGLYVVAQLAHRHSIAVQLQQNIFGGTQAVIVLPNALLADVSGVGAVDVPATAGESGPAAAPGSAPGSLSTPDARDGDGVVRVGVPSATGQPASNRGGALPAPRRAVDGQHLAPSIGSREAASAPRNSSTRRTDTGHQQLSASAQVFAPQAGAGASEQADLARPVLPQRRPQQHLAPPLSEASSSPGDRVSDRGFTPGLMADFNSGRARSAAQANPQDNSDERAPTEEGR